MKREKWRQSRIRLRHSCPSFGLSSFLIRTNVQSFNHPFGAHISPQRKANRVKLWRSCKIKWFNNLVKRRAEPAELLGRFFCRHGTSANALIAGYFYVVLGWCSDLVVPFKKLQGWLPPSPHSLWITTIIMAAARKDFFLWSNSRNQFIDLFYWFIYQFIYWLLFKAPRNLWGELVPPPTLQGKWTRPRGAKWLVHFFWLHGVACGILVFKWELTCTPCTESMES